MTDAPDSRVTSDLTVLDAWRILVKPVPSGRATSYVGLLAIVALLNLSAIAAIVAVTVASPGPATLAGLLHTTFIPGLLLAFALVPPSETDAVEWLALALGFGLLVLVLGGLALALLPSPFSPLAVVGWSAAVSLVLAALAFRRGMSWQPPTLGRRSDLIAAALVVLLAAAARLPSLGYAEFQGDETEVILRATGVVQDLPDALFYHGKGPGEIVAVAMQYGLVGSLSEGAARLPFAVAGVGGVLAFYLVARRLLGTPGALAAGLLMAANGYLVAFSRITQYQSLVLVLGMLGLWCAIRWSQGGGEHWPVLAGVFMATAALAHYDALFFLPPIALVACWRLGWRGLLRYDELSPWLRGAAAGASVLALFFLPYLDSPLFALATGRIEDRVGAGFPRNNLPSIVASATLYLGTAFPILVGTLIALGAIAALATRVTVPSRRTWLLGLLWAVV